jgi:hypothetical protein
MTNNFNAKGFSWRRKTDCDFFSLSISLQFKIEKNYADLHIRCLGDHRYFKTLANFIFVANHICCWQAFQVGSESIKIYKNVLQYRLVVLSPLQREGQHF